MFDKVETIKSTLAISISIAKSIISDNRLEINRDFEERGDEFETMVEIASNAVLKELERKEEEK